MWGHDLSLVSGSGVFARGRLDVGTAVLFRETEPPTARRYLDLGCGYGVIGVALATAVRGSVVRAVDVNERAVLLTDENAAAAGLGDRLGPRHRRPCRARRPTTRSGPTRRSGSARTHCTSCC